MSPPSASVLNQAASELEKLRSVPKHDGIDFPWACRQIMNSLPGNSTCVDCCSRNPEWASVTYGVLICTKCAGRHRSYGVQNSFVKSVNMDAWSHSQVLAMLEGGNDQLNLFFDRHQMGNASSFTAKRYHTKAGLFYRSNLSKHVELVSNKGIYEGREASRRKHNHVKKQQQQRMQTVSHVEEQRHSVRHLLQVQ
jgi:hypothetical protein